MVSSDPEEPPYFVEDLRNHSTLDWLAFFNAVGPDPHALSLGGFAPRSGRRRYRIPPAARDFNMSIGSRVPARALAERIRSAVRP